MLKEIFGSKDNGVSSDRIEWSDGRLMEEELEVVRRRLGSENDGSHIISPFAMKVGDRISTSQGRFILSILQAASDNLDKDQKPLKFTLLRDSIGSGGKIAVSYDSGVVDEERASIKLIKAITESYPELKRYGQPTIPAPGRNIFTSNQRPF